MRSLFLKIFIIFWLAQSAVYLISTVLLLRQRYMPAPGLIYNSLTSVLTGEASVAAGIYEREGCSGFDIFARNHKERLELATTQGKALCAINGNPIDLPAEALATDPARNLGIQLDSDYVWWMPTTSPTGKPYFFLLIQPHPNETGGFWHFQILRFAFPYAPVGIAVGGISTFILVLLFTRPIARLRTAARLLAQGRLDTRLPERAPSSRILEDDEFTALGRDFNHMAERLESLVSAQKQLLRDVSHELRSPLARLSVALELAREDAAPEIAPQLDRIERETARLNQLIGQLLALSSMEATEPAFACAPVPLHSLLREIASDAQFEASQRDCTVVLDAPTECTVHGNRELLHRAIENLVRNAIRYTESGSNIEIRLRSELHDKRPAATLDVSDHGPGIPEAEIQAIFRPFYRVDRARSTETGGFGVGLAIAERAIKLHCGELKAFNRPQGGITMRLTLPQTNTPA